MKIFQPFFAFALTYVLLAVILSSCAPYAGNSFIPQESDYYANTDSERNNTPAIQYTENEPEQGLEEELTALDKVGKWDENPKAIEPTELKSYSTGREPYTAIRKAYPVERKSGEESLDISASEESEIVTYDFPVVINKQVEFYLDLFQTKQRPYFKRWLSRSTRYLPFIKDQLREAGLPEDLAYLAMIESGYNPSAYSKSKAVGMWQFISSTGKNYGLEISTWIDERRDPEKSTKAAIDYLAFLYGEFNSWHLAVAAYNAGEGKIGRGIQKYQTNDFWKLAGKDYLSLETKRYVPKLIAAIIIAKEPEKYGFDDVEYQEPLEYELIKVPPRTDLNAVALASSFDVDDIRDFNNELLKNYTPPGKKSYGLKIPSGTYDKVSRNLSRLHPVVTTDFKTHVVQRGDTLTAICRRYNLSKTTLLKANNLHSAKLLAGQRLRIPYQATKYVLLKNGETPETRFAASKKDGQLYLHEIKKGDTLSKIAKLYNVSVEIIMQWNNLESVNKITAGQQLALYLDRPAPTDVALAGVGTNGGNAGSADKNNKVTYYMVKNGDSLWAIAQKFQVSANEIKKWNNLSSNLIYPGVRLVVKKV